MIVPFMEIKKIKEEVIDITKEFDFSYLKLNLANNIEKFYYFYNEQSKCYSSVFILTDQLRVQRRCKVTLIENSSQKLSPRFEFFTWDKIEKEKIKEMNTKPIKARVDLEKEGSKNFWRLIGFLMTIKNIELKGFSTYKIISSNFYISEFKTKEEYQKVEELKKLKISNKTLKKYLSDERSKIIGKFREMLEDNKNIKQYKQDFNIIQSGHETAWHHFLKNNDWLLGLNVDIRFIKDFTNEVQVGNPDTAGLGNPKTDMMGISDYTTLIELKTASTDFFTETKSSKSRTGTWSFTSDFIEGISQCLKQKFDWDKEQKGKDLKKDNELVNQNINRTVDPKVIFIIGNKQRELNIDDIKMENITKRDTLERFKRNNRNVEIISYDELYERAYFIVNHEKAPKLNFADSIIRDEVKTENTPF